MKLLFNQSKITILISVILLAIFGHSIDPSDKVAVIFSGPGFHHGGVKLRESLLEKNYDVHLVEVHAEGIINIEDWSKTPLGKDLDGHYKQLLFIVTAHGNEQFGAHILWESLLTLMKLFEQKADEIFIHLETCFSGDAAERWLPQLGNNLKVLTTSSCRGNTTSYNPQLMDWDIVNQIFTGYYLETIGFDRAANAHKHEFEKLTCTSTVSQLAQITSAPCKINEKKCTRLHVWKGETEQLTNWNILPINLTVENCLPDGQVSATFHHEFNENCKVPRKPFDNTRDVDFSPALSMEQGLVNTKDPINAWKLRTYEIPQHGQCVFKPVPKEMKDKKIDPYSTILDINGDQCNINQGCDRNKGQEQLKSVYKMTLGSYNTREIWILKDDYINNEVEGPSEDFFMNFILIPICVIVGLGIVIGIIVFFCCCKKKRQPARQVNPNASVQIYTPPQPYSTATKDSKI